MKTPLEYQETILALLSQKFGDKVKVATAYQNKTVSEFCTYPAVIVNFIEAAENEFIFKLQVYSPVDKDSQTAIKIAQDAQETIYALGESKISELKYDSKLRAFNLYLLLYIKKVISFSIDEQSFDIFPNQIKIISTRQIKRLFSPCGTDITQDLGKRARVISITGVTDYAGYQTLYTLHQSPQAHTFNLSGFIITVFFTNISTTKITESKVYYQLTFTEAAS